MTRTDDCPWCDMSFQVSEMIGAGLKLENKRKEHMNEEHPEKLEDYKKICEIWYEKVINNKGYTGTFKEMLTDIFHKGKGQRKPGPKVVDDYTPEEFRNLDEEKVREIAEEY